VRAESGEERIGRVQPRMPLAPLVEQRRRLGRRARRDEDAVLGLVPFLRGAANPLRRELVDNEQRSEGRQLLERRVERLDVMEDADGHRGIERLVELAKVAVQELGSGGRARVDAPHVVARRRELADEAAAVAAADLEDAGGRRRQLLEDELEQLYGTAASRTGPDPRLSAQTAFSKRDGFRRVLPSSDGASIQLHKLYDQRVSFRSVDALDRSLREASYLPDRGLATAIYLALEMRRPLLLEGEAGVGKTEVAKTLARVLDAALIRLQCYEGIDASQALYEWDYARQLLAARTGAQELYAP